MGPKEPKQPSIGTYQIFKMLGDKLDGDPIHNALLNIKFLVKKQDFRKFGFSIFCGHFANRPPDKR